MLYIKHVSHIFQNIVISNCYINHACKIIKWFLKGDLVGPFLFSVVDTVIFYDDINRYYYSLLINKAELVEDNLQTPKRGNLKRDLNLRQFREKFVGGALATVTFDVIQGTFVSLLGLGCTGVGDQRNQIAQVACITNRWADALIRQ